ncbi:Ubiquinone biosynthesis O-methyltransferase, mitochondrial [Sinobacterium norvegicum]|uniref:Ubiquinone biosynthesis O-methyltransferase, mitochondrial n=1 Tax=Sinobacterium norvegicum TaxID=1641715 RepID=A0ABM9AGD7_9GAMM|nr:class I SAM-dependent methyltransferase [Sinobacterium norvegicum]CAH0992276.1 Ubiquinone biosynthesis O-methyltransferase, mitochondrial [Sinobacterium norvegicum]
MKKLLVRIGLWLVSRFQETASSAATTEPVQSTEPDFPPIFQDTLLSGWFNSDNDELFKGFPISEDDVVLDVGCGDSPFLEFCAERGADIMFADIDADNVAVTERKLTGTNAKSLTPIVSDANPLPLDDCIASKVIAMEVMEHVDDPQAFLAELVRVGKSGAQYLLTVPDPVAEHLQAEGLAPQSYFEKPNHVRIIERDEFINMVEASGLVIEKVESYGFYWSMWWVFFWGCKQELGSEPPHPLLANWTKTWEHLLSLEDGEKIKSILDGFMPKSQAIVARKP